MSEGGPLLDPVGKTMVAMWPGSCSWTESQRHEDLRSQGTCAQRPSRLSSGTPQALRGGTTQWCGPSTPRRTAQL